MFSHWSGNTCVAATPVRISDTPELAELLQAAIARAVSQPEPVVTQPVLTDRSA